VAAFDFDFEDHGFHHFFFFLETTGREVCVVGVIGVVAAIVPALLLRLLRTRRGRPIPLGSSFGGAFCGNLRNPYERCYKRKDGTTANSST
jgi:hypothetical protein